MSATPQQLFCHYPHIPPPVPVRLVVLPEHPCPYLPGRPSQSRAFLAGEVDPGVYHRFMDAGFRRSGRLMYQPVCRQCRECRPLRVPVDAFRPDKGQRRCERRNGDLRVTLHTPVADAEKFDLYRRYYRDWHDHVEEPSYGSFVEFLYDSPVDSVEFQYRDAAGRLMAVGLCDVCPRSLSSVYFYFDPAEAKRGLGTFGALYEIAHARDAGIPHYYLGYWIADCGAMRYKASFRPTELLDMDGTWRPRSS